MALLLAQPVQHVLRISGALCHDGGVPAAVAINRRAPRLLLDLDLGLRRITALVMADVPFSSCTTVASPDSPASARPVVIATDLMLPLTLDHRLNCRRRRLFDDRAGPGARTDDAGADRAGLIAGHNPLRRLGRNIPSAGSTERRQNISLY
jgi:hypothetical protein